MNYIFDVDGTLTPSRGKMDKKFESFFEHFATHNACYLVTGSNREKTLEQIPEHIYNLCLRVYQCSGNNVFEQNKEVYVDPWTITNDVNIFLLDELDNSRFYRKTGYHFDYRPGLVNFSIVGRQCNLEDRAMYKQWDEHKLERQGIAERFNKKFGETMQATVAGETGIDITEIGKGKVQILRDFKDTGEITFIGDKTMEGGNDHDIAEAVKLKGQTKRGWAFQVEDWEDTYRLLWALQNAGVHEHVGVV